MTMEPTETTEIRTMRVIAWERAKGELQAVLQTYWNNFNRFHQMENEVLDFIKRVEDEGLQE